MFTKLLVYQVFISLVISIISFIWNKKGSSARELSLLNIPIIILLLIYLALYAIIYASAGAGAIVS